MSPLTGINDLRLMKRWALKAAIFLLVVFVVLFPRIDRLPASVARYRNPNALVDPEAPALMPLIAEFESKRSPEWDRQQLMAAVERFVYAKIRYDWDWNIWGNADYFPTVQEALAQGREDCDGRAIVAASMLRRYGFNSRLVSDFSHVWVKTDEGQSMSPHEQTGVEFTDEGMTFDWRILKRVPAMFCYGLSVFPLWREAIIVGVLWLLLIGRHVRPRDAWIWLATLLLGLMLIREGGDLHNPQTPKNVSGALLIAGTMAAMVLQSRRASRQAQFGFEAIT